MLRFIYCYADCRYAECHLVRCYVFIYCYAECVVMLSVIVQCHYAECLYAGCCILFIVMPMSLGWVSFSVIVLNVIMLGLAFYLLLC